MSENWIKVTDRLPDEKESKDYLIIFNGRNHFGFFNNDLFYLGDGSYSVLYKVTHWMPLPEPPKDL